MSFFHWLFLTGPWYETIPTFLALWWAGIAVTIYPVARFVPVNFRHGMWEPLVWIGMVLWPLGLVLAPPILICATLWNLGEEQSALAAQRVKKEINR